MTKRKKSFKKVVEQRSRRGLFSADAKLLKRMDDYFKDESERWRRIKKRKQ